MIFGQLKSVARLFTQFYALKIVSHKVNACQQYDCEEGPEEYFQVNKTSQFLSRILLHILFSDIWNPCQGGHFSNFHFP